MKEIRRLEIEAALDAAPVDDLETVTGRNERRRTSVERFLEHRDVDSAEAEKILSDLESYAGWEREVAEEESS